MDGSMVIDDLRTLGFSGVAEETVRHARSQMAGFEGMVEAAAAQRRDEGDTPELLDAVRRIGLMLRAASRTTAGLVEELGLLLEVQSVYECALRYGELFKWLAAYSRGDAEAGERARHALVEFLSPADPGDVFAGNGPPRATFPAHIPAQPDAVPVRKQPRHPPDVQETKPRDRGLHIYAGKGALTITVEQHPRTGQQVLMVDATHAVRERTYDWSSKITMMLMPGDLILVFAVLTGMLEKMETAPRGAGGKRLRLEDQGGSFFMRVSQGARAVAVPIPAIEGLQAALLISNALVAAHPQLRDMNGLMEFVRPFVDRVR